MAARRLDVHVDQLTCVQTEASSARLQAGVHCGVYGRAVYTLQPVV